MVKYDLILLTDAEHENPVKGDSIKANVLLEDEILGNALEKRGFRIARFDWARKDVDWSESHYLLFRTTWDYQNKWNQFLSFLNETKHKSIFINPIETIEWNFDKRYLLELEKKGINIAKTTLYEVGSIIDLEKEFSTFSVEELVIKPIISAGGRHTYRINKDNYASKNDLLNELVKEEAMMVQEFQFDVPIHGEISLMFFGGIYTHAILKLAKEGDFRVQDDFGGSVHDHIASKEEIQFAENTLSKVRILPAYARVDIFRDNNGELALAEIELIEPELWFRNNPAAADVLADYLKNYCK